MGLALLMLFHLVLVVGSFKWVHSVSTLPQPTHHMGVPGTFFAFKRLERTGFVCMYICLALVDMGIWMISGGEIYLVTALAMGILPLLLLTQRIVQWVLSLGAICLIAYVLMFDPHPLPPVDVGYYLLGVLIAIAFVLQLWVPLDHLQL